MIIKEQKLFEKWVSEQVDYYLPILGLELNNVGVKLDDEDTDYLKITLNYPYLDPTIKYSEEVVDDWKKGELKKDLILHELCHIITDPLYVKAIHRYVSKDEILDERERLTDTISAIIRKYC